MAEPKGHWHIDFVSPHQAYMYAIKKHIYSGTTKYQQVDIVETFTFGRTLLLDGKIQSSEMDEYIYHEIMVHPAMILHPAPRSVLIIGGGEGAMVRELLKYPTVEKIVMVDLDEEVVELCRKYLPSWHAGSFDDDRLELLHMDARKYIEDNNRTFDIIISDLTEPVDDGPSYLLFTKELYTTLIKRLTPCGILTVQAGSFNLALLETFAAVKNTLQLCFNGVYPYHSYIPCYDSLWGFILASQDKDPLQVDAHEVDRRLGDIGQELRFYDGETHRSMFSVSKDLRQAMEQEKRIIEDGRPLIIY